MNSYTTQALLLPLQLALALLPACDSSSSSGGDDDTDTDTDTGTGLDLSWDGGPEIPCDGEGEPDEVCIPGGTYLMGCMPYDTWCEENEKPMVEVTLSPFWIERTETTNEEVIPWLNSLGPEFTKADHWVTDAEGNDLYNSGYEGSAPICLNGEGEYVFHTGCGGCWGSHVDDSAGGFSWLGAKLFCEWQGKRLPTEAEWEAAARGRTKLIWPCAWQHLDCWYGAYSSCAPDGECYDDACCIPFHPDVAGNCDSPYGVELMYGNALEPVLDSYGPDHSSCAEGCTDPQPASGETAVPKGGSVGGTASSTRISARRGVPRGVASKSLGARCVRSPISFEQPDAGPDGGK